jgi:predicted naringenin-chalcone synthase
MKELNEYEKVRGYVRGRFIIVHEKYLSADQIIYRECVVPVDNIAVIEEHKESNAIYIKHTNNHRVDAIESVDDIISLIEIAKTN